MARINKKSYSVNQLKEAIKMVKLNKMTATQASKKFKIPRTTINNHVIGNTCGFKVGRPTLFSYTEEFMLVKLLLSLSIWGFGICIAELTQIVKNYAIHLGKPKLFKNGVPGRDWLLG